MMRSFPCAYPALYRGLETVSVHSPVCVRGNAGLARKYGAEAVIFLKAALRSDFRKRQVLSLGEQPFCHSDTQSADALIRSAAARLFETVYNCVLPISGVRAVVSGPGFCVK